MPTTNHARTCPLCEAACGLKLRVEDGRVAGVRGDAEDVFSRGFICPKGASLGALHDDPDRLRTPIVRRAQDPDTNSWEEVTWEEAFAEVERRLTPVLQSEDRNAIGVYSGNPNVHNLDGLLYGREMRRALGTENIFSASTVDQMPKEVASGLLFGSTGSIAVPDLDRTDFLIMLGANPWESNGSMCTAPDFPGRLKNIQGRGGRFVVVDPRRTRTAEHADEHLAIVPGTDALWLMAMIHVLFDEDRVQLGKLASLTVGVETIGQRSEAYAPEVVAPITGIAADTTRRLARELAATPRAVVYGRIGTHTTEFGTLAAWAVDALNLLSGHLDVPGGAMWPLPAHRRPRVAGPGRGFTIGRRHSRVMGYPEVRGEYPAATLADEILTDGPGRIRALLTVAGNPVLSTPDGARLARGLRTLCCMISVDPYLNETTRFAHVILPPPSPLERSHYDLALYGLSVRNVAKWSAPVFRQAGPSEADILARLTLIARGQPASTDPTVVHHALVNGALARCQRQNAALAGRPIEELSASLVAERPVDRLVEILVRGGAYGDGFGSRPGGLTFEQLRDTPEGIDLGPLMPRLPDLLETRSGHVELAPQPIVEDLARLGQRLSGPQGAGLLLVGRRDLRSNNSWMHNLRPLVKGPERCFLQMHPEDASELGIEAGHEVRVANATGSVTVTVQLTDLIMRGVVSLPHGWGHNAPGSRLSVAAERPGVNSNSLTPSTRLDPLSGNATLNGIPVQISRA